MSNETMKVLEMLEAGKITAEDAERLLKALGEKTHSPTETSEEESIEKGVHKIVEKVMKVVPGVVSAAVSAEAATGNTKESNYTFESPQNASIKIGAGDITIASADKGDAHISVSGIHRINFDSKQISAKIGNGVSEFELPENISVAVKIGAGNVELDAPRFDSLALKTGSGDVEGEFSCNDAEIAIGVGNIDLTMEEFDSTAVKIGKGDASLSLPGGGTIEMNVSHKSDVSLPESAEIIKDEIIAGKSGSKRRNIVAKIAGENTGNVKMNIGHGDITIE